MRLLEEYCFRYRIVDAVMLGTLLNVYAQNIHGAMVENSRRPRVRATQSLQCAHGGHCIAVTFA